MEMAGRGFHGDYRFGYQGSEKDNEVSGEGNSYTTEFRQLDPRLGRWFSVDPWEKKYPYITPYASMFNNPINLNDPKGLGKGEGCKDCEDGEKEGEKKIDKNGKSWYWSNDQWVKYSKDLENQWVSDKKNGQVSTDATYFDWYAGKFGYDPGRDDWDQEDPNSKSYTYWKWSRKFDYQANYFNDLADALIEHYAYGQGATFPLYKNYVQEDLLDKKWSVLDFVSKEDIDNLKVGEKLEIDKQEETRAGAAGTLGKHQVQLKGTLVKGKNGAWTFKGTFIITDHWDFNKQAKPRADEGDVTTAREGLWGTPFDIRGEFQVIQSSSDVVNALDLFKDANTGGQQGLYQKTMELLEE